MPIKKKAKKVQNAKFKVQSERAVPSAQQQTQSGTQKILADFETALANINTAIADLTSNTNTEAKSPASLEALPKVGPPLATPAITNTTTIGSHSVRVSWDSVANASGYLVRYSTDETFATNVDAVTTDVSVTEVTLNELQPDTTYYISVKAIGSGIYLDSPFSAAQPVTTGSATNGDIATQLQNWLTELQTLFENFSALVPQLETTVLDTTDRRRLLGSGVRRYGFIEKVAEVSGEFPQFWPAFADEGETLRERVREIDVLRNLLVWFRFASRLVGDLLLVAGDDAFRMANTYYATARDGARRRVPEAQQVFQLLQLFWKRRRRSTEEPTIPEVERDLRALLRGTKDGEIIVRNESDRVVKGEKVIIDNTQKAQSSKFQCHQRNSAVQSEDQVQSSKCKVQSIPPLATSH